MEEFYQGFFCPHCNIKYRTANIAHTTSTTMAGATFMLIGFMYGSESKRSLRELGENR